MKIYPIKFDPILKQKIWGGNKLRNQLKKPATKENIGESWEVSGVDGTISEVNNGEYTGMNLTDLQSRFTSEFLGQENYNRFGDDFPLLIKFLDAKTNLSVQVHPDDTMAKKYHDSYGKTEMWYVMESEPDAEIILGLEDGNDDMSMLNNINAENVHEIFKVEKVNKGDAYFIPAGEVHAIGAGVMVAEIQQTSDITYRVYDWGRMDNTGTMRELHTQLAQAATKRNRANLKRNYSLQLDETSNLVSSNYFTTNIFEVNWSTRKDYSNLDSFVIFMCVEGHASITVNNSTEILETGETILIPAAAREAIFYAANAKLLEVYVKSDDSVVYPLGS